MNKSEILEIFAEAHLTIEELKSKRPELSGAIDARLLERARRTVASTLVTPSEKLKKLVDELELPLDAGSVAKGLHVVAVESLRRAVDGDARLSGDREVGAALEALGKRTASEGAASPDATLAVALQLDEPLAFHPEFRKELDAARLYRLTDATKLGDEVAEALIESIGKPTAISDIALDDLVRNRKLSKEQADAAGRAATLYNVLDERAGLVEAVAGRAETVRELVAWDVSAWKKVIEDSQTQPPGDISVELYASLIVGKIRRLFPTDALAHVLATSNVGDAVAGNDALDALRDLNRGTEILRGAGFDALDTKGLSEARVTELRAAYDEVLRLSRRYGAMKVAEVLDDTTLNNADRTKEVQRRTGLVADFLGRNEDLLNGDIPVDARAAKGLSFPPQTSAADQRMLLATARTFQRALTITEEIDEVEALLEGGYHSALAVARSEAAVVAQRTGLTAERVNDLHERAEAVAASVSTSLATILETLRDELGNTNVGNLATDAVGYLKEIPGFSDFFGDQNFCNCRHCQSILGPAAYFVDLMGLVQSRVTTPYFLGRPDHPLRLDARRPDLWTLELTCENTNTPIPYLVVINEVLENAVARADGFVGNFGDRAAVERRVYRDTLERQVDSFRQPLNLGLEQLRAYARHFQRSLADIGEAGHASGAALARLRLGVSPRDHQLITQPNTNVGFLRRIYSVPFIEAGGGIRAFDAQLLLEPMGVSRDELGALIRTRFVTDRGAQNIHIDGEKRSAQSVQNDVENIIGLTRAALDRLHRFVRLWRATGWRIGELDLVLTHLDAAGYGYLLDAGVVEGVARVHRLAAQSNVSVEEHIALWSTIPRDAVLRALPGGSGGYPATAQPNARLLQPLFSRLFNQATFVKNGGLYPKPGTGFLHPALARAAPGGADLELPRLLASLGATDDELVQLIQGLADPLGIDLASNADADKTFSLSERNLGLLYRHLRLARLLRRSVPEVFVLAALADALPNHYVEDLGNLEAIIELDRWVRSTPWPLADLLRIQRPGHPARYTSTAAVVGSAAGVAVTYIARLHGVDMLPETVTLGANATLDAVVADWNGQAAHTVAYRANAAGLPAANGTFLSIRTVDAGAAARLEVTADAVPWFGAGGPAQGRELATSLAQPGAPAAATVVQGLLDQVEVSGALVFAETVFALMPPTSPVTVSTGPVAGTAVGDSVTFAVTFAGDVLAPETIVFGANASLDAVVADWNGAAVTTRAFRSSAAGEARADGDHLAITVVGAGGRATRIQVTAAAAGLFALAESRGAEITEEQSRAIVAQNQARLEPAGAPGTYRLAAAFDPSAPLALPAGIDASVGPILLEMLRAYHGVRLLPTLMVTAMGVEPEALRALSTMLAIDFSSPRLFRVLRRDVGVEPLAEVVEALRRLDLLFRDRAVFTVRRLAFIADQRGRFGIGDFRLLSSDSVRDVETFRALLAPWNERDEAPPDLEGMLTTFDPVRRFDRANRAEFARLLGCDEGLLGSMTSNLALGARPLLVLRQLARSVEFARHTGVGGRALRLAQSQSYDDLATAAAAFLAAFRAKYPDEEEWNDQIEPFRDVLLARCRDGLVAYLVHLPGSRFHQVNDLYHYYLLDVELDGCARTSRVAAAIDSVQLYVHRTRMNLEETHPDAAEPYVHVLPESVPSAEWSWRQNFRVWEANRRVFLHPENFIEPQLRDDKTPLFRDLEEELLSKEITDEAIIEAYARYLRGFDELASLTIAGSYHEKSSKADVLHLCGVTADEPPTFYYRRVDNARHGAVSDATATRWGAWEKMDVQVPVNRVSPVVHRGQLYIFWNRYTTKPKSRIEDGSSTFAGYEHRAFVEFSKRRVDGSWTAPQKVQLDSEPFGPAAHPEWYGTGGTIADPIVTKNSQVRGFVCVLSLGGVYAGTVVANSRGEVTVAGSTLMLLPADLVQNPTVTNIMVGIVQVHVTPLWASVQTSPLYGFEPHQEPKDGYVLDGFGWDRPYPASDGTEITLRGFNFQMHSAVDLYRLRISGQLWLDMENKKVLDRGVPWTNPAAVAAVSGLIYLCTCGRVDLRSRLLLGDLVWSRTNLDQRSLFRTTPGLACFDSYTFATVLSDDAHVRRYATQMATSGPWTRPQWDASVTDYLRAQLTENPLGTMPTDGTLDVVNGSVGDVILQTSQHAAYLQGGVRSDGRYHLRRLNTTASRSWNNASAVGIGDILFSEGLDALLATSTQLALGERDHPFDLLDAQVEDDMKTGELDYDGAMGTYLREVFFHIPFLIADHLNAQGRFDESQRWYHYIFDPTAAETIPVDPALSPEDQRIRQFDRNWRYREFRNRNADSLRSQLTNRAAIEAYHREPFNPHAIARLRTSAFQKAIVMKYVDNLLDWGDELFMRAFAEQNPEWLRLASLKYVTAQEVLGPRPAILGDCGEGALHPKTYPAIRAHLDAQDTEFLMEMESQVIVKERYGRMAPAGRKRVLVDAARAEAQLKHYEHLAAEEAIAAGPIRTVATTRALTARVAALDLDVEVSRLKGARVSKADYVVVAPKAGEVQLSAENIEIAVLEDNRKIAGTFTISFVTQIDPIFCIPGNDRMLAYWDRVRDRLYKLRHCMDIDGVPRQLPLFAPPIDPALLVRARAAGLSLDDVLGGGFGSLPPYRFDHLLATAKSYAAAVQAFGTALLGALEKRDAEELARLRNTHQKNLLQLTTQVKRKELQIAEEGVVVAARREAAAQYRSDYYDGLISAGLTGAEQTQRVAQVTSAVLRGASALLDVVAGIAHLVPQVGSPMAMKFGGLEVGNSSRSWSGVLSQAAGISDAIGSIAGIEAGFQRREEGWIHQKELADKDLETLEKEKVVAELRREIASRDLELHETTKAQQDEIIELYGDKFTNLGLYAQLSRSLQQLHRMAYDGALAAARLAEQAFRFERPGDNTIFVGGEWDAARSGLLAGERLGLALQRMERRFIETDKRLAEVNQSFSLAQIDPQALVDLKEAGWCEFAVPELLFDMFYPGHYRRRIRSVRVTIPCVTGPFTNVSAQLTLLASHIRRDHALGAANLLEVPPAGTTTVATSSGQNDGGVFELSFSDRRYLPFEGAGAISAWRLELPGHFRPFDYHSINDVILTLSYTAESDGALRREVESRNAAVAGSVLEHLTNNDLMRVFSLRSDFPGAFDRLLHAPLGTAVALDVDDRHFPIFVQGRALAATAVHLVVVVEDRATNLGALAFDVNGVNVGDDGAAGSAFPAPSDPPDATVAYAGLPYLNMTAAFAAGPKGAHTIAVTDAGGIAPGAGPAALDAARIRDLLIAVSYRLA